MKAKMKAVLAASANKPKSAKVTKKSPPAKPAKSAPVKLA